MKPGWRGHLEIALYKLESTAIIANSPKIKASWSIWYHLGYHRTASVHLSHQKIQLQFIKWFLKKFWLSNPSLAILINPLHQIQQLLTEQHRRWTDKQQNWMEILLSAKTCNTFTTKPMVRNKKCNALRKQRYEDKQTMFSPPEETVAFWPLVSMWLLNIWLKQR